MAFTFNWAGVNINPIQGGSHNYEKTLRDDYAALGNFMRGYEQRKANQEYADMLKEFENPNTKAKILEIKAEIARLEKRNEEIKAQIGG